MCGRFALFAAGDEVAERFQLADVPQLDARYNIAPTQPVAVVRQTVAGRELDPLRWGLIPSWATDAKIAYKLINARAETVGDKPAFRSAFKQRRCLIPVSAFYEWQQGKGRSKQAYCIRPRDGSLFAFAGLWERWHDPQGKTVETCTILTTEANELMRPLHERMPVILDSSAEARWLDSQASADVLRSLCVPFASNRMEFDAVGAWVNSPQHEGPQCLEPMGVWRGSCEP